MKCLTCGHFLGRYPLTVSYQIRSSNRFYPPCWIRGNLERSRRMDRQCPQNHSQRARRCQDRGDLKSTDLKRGFKKTNRRKVNERWYHLILFFSAMISVNFTFDRFQQCEVQNVQLENSQHFRLYLTFADQSVNWPQCSTSYGMSCSLVIFLKKSLHIK